MDNSQEQELNLPHSQEVGVSSADYRNKLIEIEAIHEGLAEEIDQITIDYATEIDTNGDNYWRELLKMFQSDVREHRSKVTKKAIDVRQVIAAQAVQTGPPNSSMETEKIDLLRRQVQALEDANKTAHTEKAEKLSDTVREIKEKRNAALAKAKTKYASIDDDISELEEKVNAVEDWSGESNLSI